MAATSRPLRLPRTRRPGSPLGPLGQDPRAAGPGDGASGCRGVSKVLSPWQWPELGVLLSSGGRVPVTMPLPAAGGRRLGPTWAPAGCLYQPERASTTGTWP
jgi:hypothetical protein